MSYTKIIGTISDVTHRTSSKGLEFVTFNMNETIYNQNTGEVIVDNKFPITDFNNNVNDVNSSDRYEIQASVSTYSVKTDTDTFQNVRLTLKGINKI